jgi:transcriptional regulator with XRE-family HTH domain
MLLNRDAVKLFGQELRQRRRAAGLSQIETAKGARVGRSTLIHLEQGAKDVRLSSAFAIAQAVGASIAIGGEPAELAGRRQARAEESLRLAARRERHLRLALDLALGRPGALRALEAARAMVRLWKTAGTCSPFYIERWSKVLRGEPTRVARRIGRIDPEWLDAMLQNTPFTEVPAAR